jgi:hypothetical protein
MRVAPLCWLPPTRPGSPSLARRLGMAMPNQPERPFRVIPARGSTPSDATPLGVSASAGRAGPCGTDRLAHEESGDTDMRRPEPHAAAAGSTAAEQSMAAKQQLRALIPPMTPWFILRALFGVILFFCGIVFGVWLIIRFRRLDRGNGAPDALNLRRRIDDRYPSWPADAGHLDREGEDLPGARPRGQPFEVGGGGVGLAPFGGADEQGPPVHTAPSASRQMPFGPRLAAVPANAP